MCAAATAGPLAVTAASVSSAAHSSSSCLQQPTNCQVRCSGVYKGSKVRKGTLTGRTHLCMGLWASRMTLRLASSSVLLAYTAQCACACRRNSHTSVLLRKSHIHHTLDSSAMKLHSSSGDTRS